MHTNIPIMEVKSIIKDALDRDHHAKHKDKKELI
jgi:hypothetical protein